MFQNPLRYPAKYAILILLILVLPVHAAGQETKKVPTTEVSGQSVFLIGNSLTWDARPPLLDGLVHWHVDCGKSLAFIQNNPQNPCVKSSTLWPRALQSRQYDFLCLQPHYGTTLDQDVEAISTWVQQQKKAVIVIHTGWAKHELLSDEKSDASPNGPMTHSDTYFTALLTRLRTTFPNREFRCTHAMNLLFYVADDIDTGVAPFDKLTDVYRDAIHMKNDTGRFLMHNAMRLALGQSVSENGFPQLNETKKKYLLGLLSKLQSRHVRK